MGNVDIQLAFEAHLLLAFISGIIGAVIVTIILYGFKATEKNLDVAYILGSYFVDAGKKAKLYTTGLILQILIGGMWGVLFVVTMFGLSIEPTWLSGILWGFAIGIIVGVLMSTICQSHPYMGEGKEIPDPGILGSDWNNFMPYIILGTHVIFGVVTLFAYREIFGSVVHFP